MATLPLTPPSSRCLSYFHLSQRQRKSSSCTPGAGETTAIGPQPPSDVVTDKDRCNNRVTTIKMQKWDWYSCSWLQYLLPILYSQVLCMQIGSKMNILLYIYISDLYIFKVINLLLFLFRALFHSITWLNWWTRGIELSFASFNDWSSSFFKFGHNSGLQNKQFDMCYTCCFESKLLWALIITCTHTICSHICCFDSHIIWIKCTDFYQCNSEETLPLIDRVKRRFCACAIHLGLLRDAAGRCGEPGRLGAQWNGSGAHGGTGCSTRTGAAERCAFTSVYKLQKGGKFSNSAYFVSVCFDKKSGQHNLRSRWI